MGSGWAHREAFSVQPNGAVVLSPSPPCLPLLFHLFHLLFPLLSFLPYPEALANQKSEAELCPSSACYNSEHEDGVLTGLF